jgi:polygalacturonase
MYFYEIISVGSLGKNRDNEEVYDVYVRNCTFIGTTNGGRIKTVPVSITNKVKYFYVFHKNTDLPNFILIKIIQF